MFQTTVNVTRAISKFPLDNKLYLWKTYILCLEVFLILLLNIKIRHVFSFDILKSALWTSKELWVWALAQKETPLLNSSSSIIAKVWLEKQRYYNKCSIPPQNCVKLSYFHWSHEHSGLEILIYNLKKKAGKQELVCKSKYHSFYALVTIQITCLTKTVIKCLVQK